MDVAWLLETMEDLETWDMGVLFFRTSGIVQGSSVAEVYELFRKGCRNPLAKKQLKEKRLNERWQLLAICPPLVE